MSSVGLIAHDEFWAEESGAPLLSRNSGFLKQGECAAILERCAKWPALVGVTDADELPSDATTRDPSFVRIVACDAERTFVTEGYRTQMREMLQTLHLRYKDYHQGLGS